MSDATPCQLCTRPGQRAGRGCSGSAVTARDVPVAFGAALIGLLVGLVAGVRGLGWVEGWHARTVRRAGAQRHQVPT